MSLIQVCIILYRDSKGKMEETDEEGNTYPYTVNHEGVKKSIMTAVILNAGVSMVLAVVTGVFTQMPVGRIVLWVGWTTFSAVVAPVLVGICAMRSGWFPAFAITTIFLSLGLFMGFPLVVLALLTGYVAYTNPYFRSSLQTSDVIH